VHEKKQKFYNLFRIYGKIYVNLMWKGEIYALKGLVILISFDLLPLKYFFQKFILKKFSIKYNAV